MSSADELIKLRVSLARIAQSLDMPVTEIPGLPADWAFELLHNAACQNERGWNRLAAAIVDEIHSRWKYS